MKFSSNLVNVRFKILGKLEKKLKLSKVIDAVLVDSVC